MMLTRCPYCSTTFRVTPEQLKIRQGQVRCGQCRRVFDALRALDENVARPAPRPPATAKEEVLSWTMVQPAPPGADDGYHEPVTITGFDYVPAHQPEPAVEPVVEVPTGFQPVTEVVAQPAPESAPPEEPAVAVEAPIEAALEAPPAEDPAAEPEQESLPDDEADVEHIELDVDPRGPLTEPPSEAAPQPESVPKPDPRPRFAPPRFEPGPPTILELHDPLPNALPTWPWLLGSLIALLLVAAQLLIHYRTEIIAGRPDTRPAFVAACEMLGCQIALPHKIDLIGIDASDLAPDEKRPGTLHLTATLRNRAPYAQAWPQLEITLTDAQERPLLRRALAPAEYLPADLAAGEGFPARSEQAVLLTLTATDVPAVGYRLYVFHP
jgi:predicted Zn finger-like uncharacterized protein